MQSVEIESHQSTEISEQKERLESIQELGFNVVNCGDCGDVVIISLDDECETIECQGCGFIGEHCDYPDYVY